VANTTDSPDLLVETGFLPQADDLFQSLLGTVAWDESMSARKTASFGLPYNYSQMAYHAVAMHPDLEPVIARLQDRLRIHFTNCLLNYYETGDHSMGFHSDETEHLMPGTGVAIVSLGSPRDITYRLKADPAVRCQYTLESGSLLYMDQVVQDHWMHAIRRQKGAGPRISLTWRAIQLPDEGTEYSVNI